MGIKHVELLVEEQSVEQALRILLPRLLGDVSYEIYPYQCKDDLLAKLPQRLRGYHYLMEGNRWVREHYLIAVLVDCDDDDCHDLKETMDIIAAEAGLVTKSAARSGRYSVLNRIVIEELEAWYFGDWAAVSIAYPGVPQSIPQQARYRNPEAIRGGTWEAFERVLQKAGYFRGGLRKIEAARAIAPHMDPTRNGCRSFHVFREALEGLDP